MATEYTIKKPRDLSKINANDLGELLWWSYYLGTSPEKLLSIIHKYGNLANEVKNRIKE
jgi:hypothetical protein